jgi:hypothetical protein
MKQNRVVIVAVVLVILCLCAVVVCAGVYLLFGQSVDILDQAAATWTALPLPPEPAPLPATPGEPEPTATPVQPVVTPTTAPLAPAPSSNPVPASEVPETHLLAVDGQDVLHLVWGSTQKGYYHQERSPAGDWSMPKSVSEGFDTLLDLVELLPNPAGQICVFVNAATDSNVPSTVGLYMRCLVEGGWTPIGTPLVVGDWDHPPAFAPDGSPRVVQLNGPGRAPVRFGNLELSPQEGLIYVPQLAIDAVGGYHTAWRRRVGETNTIEYRYSGDGGQSWSEIAALADLPPLLSALSLVADGQGNLHAVAWAGEQGVFYKRWTPASGWEPAVDIAGQLVGGTWGDLDAGPDGMAHVAWGNEFAEVKHYAQSLPASAWSPPQAITGEVVTEVRLAVDSRGVRHFVWRGQDGGLYYVSVPPPPPSGAGTGQGEVVVTTDRPWYASRDPVRISVTNQLDVPIWYAAQVDCGLSFWQLKDCESLEEIQHALHCVWDEPDYRPTQLNPGETIEDAWSGMIQQVDDSGVVEEPAEPGCYLFSVPYALGEFNLQIWSAGDVAEALSPAFEQR